MGGDSQAGNAFGGSAEKAQTKKKRGICCVAKCLLWIVFKLNMCTNPYTHNKTHKTNKGRNTSDIQTSERKNIIGKTYYKQESGITVSRKMQTRQPAYKTLAGKNRAIIKYTDQSCDVSPFSEKYTPMKDIPVVSAATGFTSANGRNYILVFHEALYMPNMRHNLINPN